MKTFGERRQCEAQIKARWYSTDHRCPYEAVYYFGDKWLCGLHKSKAVRQEQIDEMILSRTKDDCEP